LAAHVMLFDDAPSWCRAMRTALIAQSFSVAASPDLASARDSAAARPPDILIVNMDLGLAAVDALRVIRRAAPHVAVLVLTGQEDPEVLAHQHKAEAGRAKKASLLELAEVVHSIHAANQRRDAKRPNLHALTRLVAIWLGRRSGTLSTVNGSALMADGAPLDDASRQLISRVLFDNSVLDFTPGRARQHPDPDRFGQLLFQAAKAGADPRFIERQKNRIPQAMPGTPRIQALNLHRDTSRLLLDGMELRLTDAVRDFGLDPETLGMEMDALMRLGLIGLSHRRHLPNKSTQPPPTKAAPTPKPAGPRREIIAARGQPPKKKQASNLDALMVLKRLRKELLRLEQADPWTVLGIAPTTSPEHIQQAAQRMGKRYRDLREDPELSDAIQEMAAKLERKVAQAAANADTQDASPDDSPRDQRLFKEAMKNVERGEFSVATRLLRGAHRIQVYEPKYQAWLGYCLAQDAKQLPDAARATVRSEASELLQLAVQLSDEAEWKLWLLQVLIDEKDLEKAKKVLRILRRDAPDTVGLSSAADALEALLPPPTAQ
jgi:DNA-binding response OmpR family regulator